MFDATMNTFNVFKHYYNNSEGFMKKDYPRYTLRVSKEMLFKLAFVADFYGRSKNREIEYMIKKHIEEFEKKYGEIPVPEKLQDKDAVE